MKKKSVPEHVPFQLLGDFNVESETFKTWLVNVAKWIIYARRLGAYRVIFVKCFVSAVLCGVWKKMSENAKNSFWGVLISLSFVKSLFTSGKVLYHTMEKLKQISQETFDAVVQENMEEFEMDLNEAVQDALDQFKTQGVDMSNLITSYVKDPDTGQLKHSNPVKGEAIKMILLLFCDKSNHLWLHN